MRREHRRGALRQFIDIINCSIDTDSRRIGVRRYWSRAIGSTVLALPIVLAACGPFGPPTPTPLPTVTYPHIVVAVPPVELSVDRIAGAWQFAVRCRESGEFATARVEVKMPSSESKYGSDPQTNQRCQGDGATILNGGIPIDGMRQGERLTILLTVSGAGTTTAGERTYVADGRGNLRPATP